MKNPKPTGGKGSSLKGPSSSSSASGGRKSRWESTDNPPSDHPAPLDPKHSKSKDDPAGPSAASPSLPPKDHPPVSGPLRPPPGGGLLIPHPDPAAALPPSPPPYGFHNLERRTIVLADGSVRSYFALPPDLPADLAADKMFPYGHGGRPGFGHGPEPGLGLGFDKRFPPTGGRFSPEDFREPPYGRGPGAQHDYWASLGLDGPRVPLEGAPSSLKRKFGEEDDFAWHRQHVMHYGNANANASGFPSGSGDRPDYLRRTGSPLRQDYHDDLRSPKQIKLGGEGYQDLPSRRTLPDDVPAAAVDVDPQALKKAFLRISKTINESFTQRKNYLEDGKNGPLQCIVCGRASKDFADVHGLIMHVYNSQNAELRVDHLGLHKALCVLMGWNFTKAPENSKAYQLLSADDAHANREDLILWPPAVIIHNTNSGRRKDGRMEGMGNKEMDTKLKELGFGGGKSKSIYGREGHTGVTMVKFANTPAGLKEAERLVEYFERENHGRKGWARAQASRSGDDDKNPALVKVDEKTGERKRIFYGYLAIASDLDKLDFDTKKKIMIKSRRELDLSD
ncbi:uncharacterized protein [Elaeis guineensis]|uniref:Uncharacterized protein LOC105053352 n=1 Tax=Elaeis guineensis var. tenera TaxID=51953 RepID=A0A6I9RUW2_ELAGV|nr:uncharacterized protein LOC105053352 [Elaeis guineensis]